ncbi:MAG: heavy-metal-associated domain-containing protein [Clostridiaceae bacterium]|nr:heavy-metal-associated domain-containing protein [Clostridiaceae bacterium]
MKKVLKIEGMTCGHCKARVEKALNEIPGVSAKVNLAKKEAVLKIDEGISDQRLIDAVQEAGYKVLSVEEKKGIFG